MHKWREFIQGQVADSVAVTTLDTASSSIVPCFGDAKAEYEALRTGPAIVDRCDRALLEITGADRGSWLHNLVTNHVKELRSGDGNYAFVCNIKGRILFDLNVIIREDAIWVDLDRGFLDVAQQHFEKYTIVEDVQRVDRSDDYARVALVGDAAKRVFSEIRAAHVGQLPILGSAGLSLCESDVTAVRTDFCGPWAVELFLPNDRAIPVWEFLTDAARPVPALPVGDRAVQACRIETGIPWSGREITNETLPAETRQSDRAVSRNKGCYLGQEVVERMRSRDALAKILVGLRIEGTQLPAVPGPIELDGAPVGSVTSVCHSFAMDSVIALAFVRTKFSEPGTVLTVTWDQGRAQATVAEWPLTP